MSVHKRGNSYFARYRDAAGKQRNKHFGVGQRGKDKAEEFDLEIKLAKKKQQKMILLTGSTMFIEKLTELYLRDYVVMGKSEQQAYNIRCIFKKLLPKLPSKPVNELTYQDMVDLIDQFPDVGATTKKNYLAYLSAAFGFGIRHGHIDVNPLQHWKRKKTPTRDFEINLDELGKIIQHSAPHLKLAIYVGYYTGMRDGASELFELQWHQVDFEQEAIHFYRSKTDSKGSIPIAKNLLPILKRAKQKAKSNYVVEYKGRQVKRITTALKNAIKRAGITKKFMLKDLRQMHASYSAAHGGDNAAVSSNLGHSDLTTTARYYIQPLEGAARVAVDAVPKLHEGGDPLKRQKARKEKKAGTSQRKKKKKKFKFRDVGSVNFED